MIDCYLPLLDLLDAGAPLTVSLTPVLCDQLEADGIGERFRAFIGQTRRTIHADDVAGLRAAGHEALARELAARLGERLRAGAAALRRPRRRPAGGLRASCPVDLGRDARDAPAAGHRRGRPPAGAQRRRLPPPALCPGGGLARRLLAARVRPRALAGADPRCGRRHGPRASSSRRASASGAREHLQPLLGDAGRRARADRPGDDRRWCGATTATRRPASTATTTATLTGHNQTVGATTAAPTTTRWPALGARARRRLRRARRAPALRDGGRRAGRVRARHRAARALVV